MLRTVIATLAWLATLGRFRAGRGATRSGGRHGPRGPGPQRTEHGVLPDGPTGSPVSESRFIDARTTVGVQSGRRRAALATSAPITSGRRRSAEILEVTQAGTKTRVGSSLQSAYQVEYVTLKVGERLQTARAVPSAWHAVDTLGIASHRLPVSSVGFESQDLQADDAVRVRRTTIWRCPPPTVPVPAPPSGRRRPPRRQPEEERDADAIDRRRPLHRPRDSGGISFEKLSQARSHMSTEPIPESPPPDGPSIALASHTEPQGPSDQILATWPRSRRPGRWSTPRPLGRSFPAEGRLEEPASSTDVSDPDLRLSEIELALSRMVTQEVDRWNLDPLRQQVHATGRLPTRRKWPAQCPTVARADRGIRRACNVGTATWRRPRRPIALVRFRSPPLCRNVRYRGPGCRPWPTCRPIRPNHFAAREAAIRRQAEDVHYAGQGYLVPVISSQPNMPRFALTDAQGSILAFVSPRPGLNLRRYQRREVGIVGRETIADR